MVFDWLRNIQCNTKVIPMQNECLRGYTGMNQPVSSSICPFDHCPSMCPRMSVCKILVAFRCELLLFAAILLQV